MACDFIRKKDSPLFFNKIGIFLIKKMVRLMFKRKLSFEGKWKIYVKVVLKVGLQ